MPLGGWAFGGERRVSESEDQRQHHGDEHAQRGARGIFGQIARIERWRLRLQLGERLEQMAACLAEEHQKTEDQKKRENVPSAEQPDQTPDGNWDVYAHVSRPGCHGFGCHGIVVKVAT